MKMFRIKVLVPFFVFFIAWQDVQQHDLIAVSGDHPANPYARSAPAIVVSPIKGPDLKGAEPEVRSGGGAQNHEPSSSPPAGAAASRHQHQH